MSLPLLPARSAGPAPASQHRPGALLPIAAIVVVALNMRAPVSGVGPVIGDLAAAVSLSPLAVSALMTLPALCFGLLAPAAPVVLDRLGLDRAVTAMLALLVVGDALRLVPGSAVLFVGTAMAAAAIAVVNVLLPAVVKRDAPHHLGLATGLYTTAFGVSATAGALVVPWLSAGRGWGPSLALAALAVPAALTLVLWARSRRTGRPATASTTGPHLRVLRDPVARWVTAYVALQGVVFYAVLAWLPAMLQAHGTGVPESGLMLAVATSVGIPVGLVVPTLAVRRADQRRLAAGASGVVALGLIGLLLAPSAALLWVSVSGLGMGATFPLGLTLVAVRCASVGDTAALSAAAQTLGGLAAALGPLGLGLLYGVTGGWDLPLGAVAVVALLGAGAGWRAGRPGLVGPVPPVSAGSLHP